MGLRRLQVNGSYVTILSVFLAAAAWRKGAAENSALAAVQFAAGPFWRIDRVLLTPAGVGNLQDF
jgi:hypothetical protein